MAGLLGRIFGRKASAAAPVELYSFDHAHDRPPRALADLLGGKGASLAEATSVLELPVPPGFTLPTSLCRDYLADGWPDGLEAALRHHVGRLERQLDRRFGDPAAPLLLSVRSGGRHSMPGMMDTVLNLGLNDRVADGLAAWRGGADFARDSHRRFRQIYRDVVLDGTDAAIPDDPWLQLRASIEAVFRSWNADRAVHYREREGIPHDLGTAVNIQAMVFGNMDARSGTGVVFTRDPATGENVLFGDFLFAAQGEDVVAGSHTTRSLVDLQAALPAVHAELRRHCRGIERHYGDMCDIEFTVEQGKLWILQSRTGKRTPGAAVRIAVEMAEEADFPFDRAGAVARVRDLVETASVRRLDGDHTALASGIGASPGIASGPVCFEPDLAAQAAADGGPPVILVRRETSPGDVHGMAAAAGILTTRGGLASHAAVVARAWALPAVVGAQAVDLVGDRMSIAGQSFRAGDEITIDGSGGGIYAGPVASVSEAPPELDRLQRWMRETAAAGGNAGEGGEATEEGLLRLLALKGFADAALLSAVLDADPTGVQTALEAMAGRGLASQRQGRGWSLEPAGRAAAQALFAVDRGAIGADHLAAVLDRFADLNGRFKALMVAWQLRDVGGAEVVNDHQDADYDKGIIARLDGIDGEIAELLADLCRPLPGYARYRSRFEAALAKLGAGEARWMAAPIIDSYHTVWFELHEELIRLAGRSRAEEGDG